MRVTLTLYVSDQKKSYGDADTPFRMNHLVDIFIFYLISIVICLLALTFEVLLVHENPHLWSKKPSKYSWHSSLYFMLVSYVAFCVISSMQMTHIEHVKDMHFALIKPWKMGVQPENTFILQSYKMSSKSGELDKTCISTALSFNTKMAHMLGIQIIGIFVDTIDTFYIFNGHVRINLFTSA